MYGVDRLVEIVGVVTRSSGKIYFHAFFYVLTETPIAMAEQHSIHIGQMIKAVFDESGMTVSEFARRIHLERTTVYSIFERPTVDVIQLVKISQALKHNFLFDIAQLYGLQPEPTTITLRMENLSPEIAQQLTSLIDSISPSEP